MDMYVKLDESYYKDFGMSLAEIYVKAGLTKSKSEFYRHVKNRAIRVNDYLITNPMTRISLNKDENSLFILE